MRVSLEGADRTGEPFRYPALVADWGLSYFEHERAIIEDLLRTIEGEPEVGPQQVTRRVTRARRSLPS